MLSSIRTGQAALVVSGILLAFTAFLGARPYYNWDMFPYMAVVMQRPGVSFDSTHREVYRKAKEYLPEKDYQAISARQPELARNPEAFHAILKYFTIKPGYTTLAEFFYRAGIHPVLATCLPSLLAFFAIGLILFFWAQGLSNPLTGAILAIIVAIIPSMYTLARYSSPDMLCTALSVGAFALILTHRGAAGLALLLLSIWVRPDALVLFVPIALALGLGGMVSWPITAGLLFLGFAGCWFILGGTDLIMEYVQVDPAESRIQLYLRGLWLPLLIVLGAGVLQTRIRKHLPPLRVMLFWAALGSLGFRFALHPVVEVRFYLPAAFLLLMIGVEVYLKRQFSALTKP